MARPWLAVAQRGERDHRLAFQGAAADAMHRLQHDRQYRCLQAEE
jgi:hypothetical protein